MILKDVAEELAVHLRLSVPDLNVVTYLPKLVTPPTAIVAYPDTVTYDTHYAPGADEYDLPIVVVIGDVWGPQAMDDLSGYVSRTGPRSIKAAVESIESPAAFDVAHVSEAEVDPLTFNQVDYLSAIFACTIIGT